MTTPAFVEAYRTHEFEVQIEGIPSPGITKVSGLGDGEVDALEQGDGGTNYVHKVSSGVIKYGDITLERHMDGTQADADFHTWFNEMFKLDGTGIGSNLRRNGSIVKKQFGQEVLRWAFEGAWVKSSKFTDLDAKADALFVQTIVLSVERVYRV